MSIMIKGMEMPKTCKECPFSDHEAWCLIPGDWRERYYCPEDERSEHCPLIELPPHEKSIDTDKLITNKKAIEKLKEEFCKLKLFCELYPDACNKENCEIYLAISVLEGKDVNISNIDTNSKQAAIDAIRSLWDNAPSAQHLSAMFDCEDAIRALPSAETEIIRCKDCKFYTPMNRETKTGICNLTMHQNFGDEWYCAGAERKTDE